MSESIDMIRRVYEAMGAKHEAARKFLGRPLTLAEKILFAHMKDPTGQGKIERKKSYVDLYPDRVAMQDATAQMALLQFMHAGMEQAAVPSTVHCDHLIQAHTGAKNDLLKAFDENQEVYDFLKTVSARYGVGFWKPGAGIIHQVVLENYAFPGGMMIGTDSHTPNAGGLGMVACGVGGADAVDVMVGDAWNVRWPGAIGVKLTGKLSGWTSAKDVILKLLGILTVKGGTGSIVEFFGDGTDSISCTGKGTIANMGAEHGATTSVFPFDAAMGRYLRATKRDDVAELAEKFAAGLRADPEVYANPEKYYDQVVHIDLSTLEPHLNGPHTPDMARPLSEMKAAVVSEKYPDQLKYTLIGSCTNSSYEDIDRAASIVKALSQHGLKMKAPLMVTPGSDQIMQTIIRDGLLETFEKAGATVLANACGPCIGQWKRDDVKDGDANSIVNSYNRNFRGRNDGNPETLSFIASPETTVAMAYGGKLSFNPVTDTLEVDGKQVKIPAPTGAELPAKGYEFPMEGFIAPPATGAGVTVHVDPKSDRLQLLERFDPWDGKDFLDLPVLLKAKGKCTTDHISPAGKWLAYRGHLDNISNNMFIGADNAFSPERGTAVNIYDGKTDKIPAVARAYKAKGIRWMVVGDENYGEGSSREHAAMSPRFLGCRVVLVRSFARIHETNLKKQGILALTFANPADYEKIQGKDQVDVKNLKDLAPGKNVVLSFKHGDGSVDSIECKHSFSAQQLAWFRSGGALNAIAEAAKAK
ncbi:MAG: aconitate hydratase [Deltaproteobacteria bacterium]|nr:aconitate hydratase [Deltaproteobacteria bacterium]